MSYYVIKIWTDGTVERYPSEQIPSLSLFTSLLTAILSKPSTFG